jgi:adenylate cyclase
MLKDEKIVGAIVIYRQQVRPFADKQIELVKNFASQAVIAIENARLLSELRQRTTDLAELLEQQTAASQVLSIISTSPAELEPVFQAILSNATRLCGAKFGNLNLYDGEVFRKAAAYDVPPEYADMRLRQPGWRPHPRSGAAEMVRTKQPVQVDDLRSSPAYGEGDPTVRAIADMGGARTLLLVPMLKDFGLVGMIGIYRKEVQPFTQKQIALVQNFAAQAVIAIENARLLNDLDTLNKQLEQRVADQVGEIERMSRLRRFLPPQVADLIVTSGTEKQLESHRREITALFCDLRGFTGFSESSDPEDVMALLRDYHAAIGEIIFKYGGTLERFAGDGVMVIFNDPVPVENPALQAVLMALDMRTAIGGMIEKWRNLGHDLGFGIGIAHGFATLGTIGFEGRRDYAAIGTVSNVASRLCDEAKPGQILISPRVMLAVDKAITVEPVGEFTLKPHAGIQRSGVLTLQTELMSTSGTKQTSTDIGQCPLLTPKRTYTPQFAVTQQNRRTRSTTWYDASNRVPRQRLARCLRHAIARFSRGTERDRLCRG